ncbi:GTP-binding protein [Muricomes intestini]|uniref:GTP-binding protein n=1 Tax=Muricomes intestini TaxID=1796634 RepID=UPI00104F5A95|nr:GTP-binding protein [Muricomes intestini]
MEVQIVSGFLGVGKTTFLNKYIPALPGKTVIIENEFGEVRLDEELFGGDISVRELYAGCICCSLTMGFRDTISEIARSIKPDRIVIEPSGVGQLSDIVNVCMKAKIQEELPISITKLITIVDLDDYELAAKNFGRFYLDQIEQAGLLLLSNLDMGDESKKQRLLQTLKGTNPKALIYENDWRQLDTTVLLKLISQTENYKER